MMRNIKLFELFKTYIVRSLGLIFTIIKMYFVIDSKNIFIFLKILKSLIKKCIYNTNNYKNCINRYAHR